MTDLRPLAGHLALVTGGSRGLGRAVVAALAARGARVAFTWARDAEGAAAAASEPGVSAHQVDVRDGPALAALVRGLEAEHGGPASILVHNAGRGQVVPVALMEESDWDEMLDTHVKGAFLATRAVLRGMVKARYGRIVMVGSLAGVKMMQAPVHYSTAKAALVGYTQSLAKEVGRYGITVNCVAPGVLEDGVSAALPPERRRQYLDHVALGRLGTFAEVAEVIAFVASPANTYMNGATVVLDGGV